MSRHDTERLNDITAAIAAIRDYKSRGPITVDHDLPELEAAVDRLRGAAGG